MKHYLIVASLLMLSACVPPPYTPQAPYDDKAYFSYDKKGNGKIYGQAFLTTRGGDVKKGAGRTVYLVPDTAYTQEMYHAHDLGRIFPHDPRLTPHIRTTVADADGNFEFNNLPAGKYYLEVTLTWEIPGEYVSQTTGSDIAKHVELKKGESQKILLTE